MRYTSRIFHASLMVCLALGMGAGDCRAHASEIVIGEFRLRGPNGGNDEFVELYNPGDAVVDVGGWRIKGSSAAGVVTVRATIPAGVTIAPGCRFLLANSTGPYSGVVVPDLTYTLGIVDDGGVALTLPNDGIVDQVGLSSGSAFREGNPLPPLTLNQDRSYERLPGGAAGNGTDEGDNATDFVLRSPGSPQGSSSGCIAPPLSPTASPTASAVATPSWTPTETVVATPTGTFTELPSVTVTASPSPTPTPTPTLTATVTEVPTNTAAPVEPTVTPSATATESPTPSRTETRTYTATASPEPTSSASPTWPPPTATDTPSEPAAMTPTATPSATMAAGCGNGIVEAGEHCDDGVSGASLDCPVTCHFGDAGWLIRGNQRPQHANRAGCLTEWWVRSRFRRMDRFGMPDYRQECVDQDPSCDRDADRGGCTFEIRVCTNTRDAHLASCRVQSLVAIDVLAPRGTNADAAATRGALLSALHGLQPHGPEGEAVDQCTRPVLVRVGLRGRRVARTELLLRAGLPRASGARHLSRLRLTCRRSGSSEPSEVPGAP